MKILLSFIVGAIIGWFIQDLIVGFSIALGFVFMWQAVEWFVNKSKNKQ